MRANWVHTGVAGLLLASALAFGGTGTSYAQSESDDTRTLTLQEVKSRLKENKKHLDEARNHGKAGDSAGMAKALENFERGQGGLDKALQAGRFNGSVFEREEAFDRVEKATRKHGEVLSGLLESGKLPEQARPHVEHALSMSQKGRQTALTNLERARAERHDQEVAQNRSRGGQSEMSGRPGNIGGPPAGVGSRGGIGGGPGGNPGAGRSAGRGPR